MGCSRREFLKKMFYVSLGATLPINHFSFADESGFSINPFAFTSLINFDDCMKCEVDGTCKIVFPKIRFWSPVGFIESAPKFKVGASSSNLDFMHTLSYPITSILDKSIGKLMPNGSFTIGEVRGSETYMKVYNHFIGFPPVVGDAVKGIAGTIETGDLACLCSITGKVTKKLIPGSDIFDKFDEIRDIDGVDSSTLDSISAEYQSALSYVPFFLSEFIMNAWDDENFAVDRYTIAPFLNAVHTAISKSSLPIGKLACPYLTHYLSKLSLGVPIPKGIDLDFLCVGHWGYGYLRTGIVRHDDPITAGLLAIARFHHLFSKTIPILKKIKYGSKIRYQLYNPQKSPCFKPGYYSTDPLVNKLMDISSPDNITEFFKHPDKLKNELKSWSVPSYKKEMPSKNQRYAGVVVWYKDKKCCV